MPVNHTQQHPHANSRAVAILVGTGMVDEDVRVLLGGRTLSWTPYLERDLWFRFGDGSDYDALLAAHEELECRRQKATDEYNADRRKDPDDVKWLIAQDFTRPAVEEMLGGPIADDVWAQAGELARPYVEEFRSGNMITGEQDMLHDIERIDMEMEAAGLCPTHWIVLLLSAELLVKNGHTPDEFLRANGLTDGLSVDVTDAPPEAVEAFKRLGVPRLVELAKTDAGRGTHGDA
jgi:hypothetical protein